ncbi:transcription factor IIA subunit alpha [Coemansia interrupta]|uniref:Transcription factor IIA subunit alpha n=1 Tax=Coemansia interrupta TaxID=1126814 RepID=A0A9W8HA50_9FUNG|nr:transcription factor IIA subunit alpha [Coemansia interrupta]
MSNSIVATIYRYVIDDVVRNVHGDFEGHGVNTTVLEELQRSWEAKIIQSRVASFPGEEVEEHASSRHNAHSYQYAHETNGNINSAASLASIINNPESMAPSAASLASLAQSGRSKLLLDDDDDGDDGHSQYIPQNDGAADDDMMVKWNAMKGARRMEYMRAKEAADAKVEQLDGAYDDDDDDDDDNDGERKGAESSRNNGGAGVEAPEDAINSDLDDTDEEDENDGDGEDTEHIVLCQYDKVTRSKNKWKCVLRDGIMLINGRDYLFQKANGDFEW